MSRKSAQGCTDKLRRRFESLASISKAVLAAHDIEVMLQDIVAEVQKSMDYDFCFCLVKDGECARLYHSLAPKLKRAISKATGLDFTGLQVHYDSEDIHWKSLERGKPLVTRNVLEESHQVAEVDRCLITDVRQLLEGFVPPNYAPRFVRKELRKERFAKVVQDILQIRSAITVPLRTNTGRNLGTFSIATRERVMDTDDMEFATLVGDLVSTAIENARLSKMVRVERGFADTLREASQALASTMEVNELLCLIVEHLGRVVAYDTASLMLLSDGTLRIKAAAALGGKAPVVQLSLPLDTSLLTDELVKKKQPIVIADTKEDERWQVVPGNGNVRSWLGVPLLVKGQVIGCLTVGKSEPNCYRGEDAQIVTAFANQAAIVIEKARLYETAKSERDRLMAIMSAMEDGVTVISKDYIVKFQNRLLVERFGDLTGQLCYKGYVGLEEPCESCPAVKAIETGEPHRVELVGKDGRDYELVSVPLRNPNGTVDAIEIVRDITKRKRAEEEIRRRSKELAALYDVSLDVAAQLEIGQLLPAIVKRAIRLLNAEAGGIYLYDPAKDEIKLQVSYGLSKDYTGTRLALGEGVSGQVAETGEPLMVGDYRRWEGRSPLWEGEAIGGVLGVPLKRGDDLLGVLTIDHAPGKTFQEGDICLATLFANQAAIAIENAGLFEEVQRTRDYLQSLIESSPDAIVTTDRQGRITLLSKGAESLFGYKASEVIAQPAANYYSDSGEPMRIMRRLLREGSLRNYEMEIIDKKGRVIPAALSASLLRDEEGAIIGTLGIIKDITDRKGLEEELTRYAEHLEEMVEERTEALRSLNEQLGKANRLKSEFVSAVSHELRAPLFAIVGMSEMLLDRGVKDRGWAMEYLQMINEQGNRLARLIDDLLDLSRIESGKQVYHWESVHIGEVIRESIQFLKAQAKGKGIAISHRIEKDLPPVEADRDKMRQVLINLISNSLNYSSDGAKVKVSARQLTVRRGPKRGEKIVAVSVTDSGWGIPPEDLPHIFEKFYRGKEHQRRTRGSGLGLALAKEIVAAHGGTVEVKSKVGKGSKFTVKLPLGLGTATLAMNGGENSL